MITQKQFSGVYFGTSKRLGEVLDGLVRDEKIEDYCYIYHHAEEAEKKDHLHFWASPRVRIDTAKLRKSLDSSDGGALPIGKSKFGDWLLYSLHDPNYLAFHALCKKHHYQLHEVISTFTQDQLQHLKEQAYDDTFPRWNILDYVKQSALDGVQWSDIITSGIIPPNQFQFYSEVYKTVITEKRKNEIQNQVKDQINETQC